MMMVRFPTRSAAVQMGSASTSVESKALWVRSSAVPGVWASKSVMPWVPGQAPVAMLVQFGGVMVGSGTRQLGA